ncbi:MAG: hypothetical protein J7525_02815 [Roseofilum sp. SID3]|nr:hypothetical protein [Roseofilum sp. SID3]
MLYPGKSSALETLSFQLWQLIASDRTKPDFFEPNIEFPEIIRLVSLGENYRLSIWR